MSQTRKRTRGWAGRDDEGDTVGESAQEVGRRSQQPAPLPVRPAPATGAGQSTATTAAVLDGLPPAWRVLHDLAWPGPIELPDHLVVGPGGVFVVASMPMPSGPGPDTRTAADPWVATCLDASSAVVEVVAAYGAPVSGVVCVDSDRHVAEALRGVMLCTTGNLSQVLRSCPPVLGPTQVTGVLAALDAHLHPTQAAPGQVDSHPAVAAAPPAGGAAVPAQPDVSGDAPAAAAARAAGRGRAARSSRGRRGRPPFGRLLVGTAMVVGLVVAGPDLAAKVGPTVADRLAGLVTQEAACAAVPPATKDRAGGAKRAAPTVVKRRAAHRKTAAKAAKAARRNKTATSARPRPSLVSHATPSC